MAADPAGAEPPFVTAADLVKAAKRKGTLSGKAGQVRF
jgi:hypothetical protein